MFRYNGVALCFMLVVNSIHQYYIYQMNLAVGSLFTLMCHRLAIPTLEQAILFLNRNARVPNKANHGARPCSSVMRRERKKEFYRRWKRKMPADTDEFNKWYHPIMAYPTYSSIINIHVGSHTQMQTINFPLTLSTHCSCSGFLPLLLVFWYLIPSWWGLLVLPLPPLWPPCPKPSLYHPPWFYHCCYW